MHASSRRSEEISWACEEKYFGSDCCGYAILGSRKFRYSVPGSLKVTITNVPKVYCKNRSCHVLLHEIAHGVLGIDSDEEADLWALSNLPECCKYF